MNADPLGGTLSLDDAVELWRGNPDAARSLAGLLEARGVSSYVRDRERLSAKGGTYYVYGASVEVSHGDLAAASEVRDAWLSSTATRADSLSGRLTLITALGAIPPAVWYCASLLLPAVVLTPRPEWLGGAWGVSTIILAQLDHRRRSRERILNSNSSAA